MISTFNTMIAFSASAMVLGFIALLAQKVYIDSNSNQPVDIEIPLLGKIKTNYPALIFVIGGFWLAWESYDKSTIEKESWYITGQLRIDPQQTSDEIEKKLNEISWVTWENGNIRSIPNVMNKSEIREKGYFHLELEVPKGQNIDDIIKTLMFDDHPFLFGSLSISDIKKYDEIDDRSREYEFLVTPDLQTIERISP